MANWLPFFVVVTALAVVVQMFILLFIYLQFKQMTEQMTRIATELQTKIDPILTRLNRLLEDSQGRMTSIVGDAAEILHLARGQAQKIDRVFNEAVDRLRLQIIRADQILTGALESVEEAGAEFRRTVWGPVQKASAFIKGVKTGLDFFRSQRRSPERAREHSDEGLFI